MSIFERLVFAGACVCFTQTGAMAASPSEHSADTETKIQLTSSSTATMPINPALLLEIAQSKDGPGLAHALARCVFTDAQLQDKAKEYLSRMDDWEKDTGGSKEDFLGARLVSVALSASGGDQEKIQKAIQFLAMYKELGLDEPQMVTTFMKEHQSSLTRLLNDFTWVKASDYVKSKRWREDIAEKRKKEKEAEERAKAAKQNQDTEQPTNTSISGSGE